jgi:hypothetical protein
MRSLLILSVVVAVFYSCSTDFDITAPYKEVMVVDGLINEWDSVQYIRISKAYLGEGDAYVMAQQKDSINYADVLSVTLTELSTGQVINLTRDTSHSKDPGTFNYPFVVLYSTNHSINVNSKYKLTVTNTSTGVTATSETKIVSDVHISPPIQDSINMAGNFPSPAHITYQPGTNGYVHELRLKFHYREIDPNGSSTYHVVDWNLGSSSGSPVEINYVYYKKDFFINLQSNIPDAQPGYVRRIDSLETGIKPVEYTFIEGTEDLDTYINLNKPASGIVIDKPLFTTITNGIGLFTSRLIHSEYRVFNSYTIGFMDTCSYLHNKGFEFN